MKCYKDTDGVGNYLKWKYKRELEELKWDAQMIADLKNPNHPFHALATGTEETVSKVCDDKP